MAPNAVVAGAPAVGKSSIIRRICGRSEEAGAQHAQHEHDGAQAEEQQEDQVREAVWSVDTKYYTAQVSLWELQVPLPPGPAPLGPGPGPGENQCPDALGAHTPDWSSCEALVLVFDLADHSSFLALQDWWSSAAEALKATRALDVQLCVGNKADSIPHHPAQAAPSAAPEEGALAALDEQRRGYLEWCLDRGFEYIEASALDMAFDARIGPAEGDSANSQGIGRLRAALQAHMWSGMLLKDPSARLSSLSGITGALNGGAPRVTGDDLSSDEEELDAGESLEELSADELGSLLGYVQLGDGEEEAELQQGPEAEGPSSSSVLQGTAGGPQHEQSEWGPFHSTASSKAPHTPGLEEAGEGGAPGLGEAGERGVGSAEVRAGQQELASGLKAADGGAASGGPEVRLHEGTAVPGPVPGQSRWPSEVAGDAAEEQLRSLEQLLGRVAAVREQGALLPDAARREMAAATALQLATLLCGKDDEEDA